jgi:hypothetical protein
MKLNLKPGPAEPLDTVLRQWTVDTPLPPRFQEQVWRRIRRRETGRASALRASMQRWLEAVLPRPKIALAYLSALMIFGVAAGSVTAQIRTSHVEARLGARYLQAVDPYYGASQP